MHLNAFLMTTGHHEASWRLPESDPHAGTDLAHFTHLARLAETGRMDSVFFADSPGLQGDVGRRPSGILDPTMLLAALAAATEHIGLIATASTTYNDPFNLARRFASLDHLSGGRAGWNIVTTANVEAARNFGLETQPTHHDRYERAAEFVDVTRKLWDSWTDDAVLGDKQAGVWAESSRVRPINHHGWHYRIGGPLNTPRPPQGHPVLVQAGSSTEGKDFAADHAEAIFTAQQTLSHAQTFYSDVKTRISHTGRDPERVKILPGVVPVIGSTEAEARQVAEQLDELIVTKHAHTQLARTLRRHPDELPLDRPLPADLPTEDDIEGAKSRYSLIVTLAREENLTVRELIGRLGGGRGHRTFTGTPEQVADTLQHWFTTGAADGFNIMPAVLPSGLQAFVEHVIPLLQQRGLFRTDYTGTTLREHYDLSQPGNQYEHEHAAIA
ncbi:LLM class flavin-dependent oxidoreductase [Allosaccharopolyspora coralli]|nr:LLM class flavin-dependent oxidoreductase [Allosaccharopolyspora coralli]